MGISWSASDGQMALQRMQRWQAATLGFISGVPATNGLKPVRMTIQSKIQTWAHCPHCRQRERNSFSVRAPGGRKNLLFFFSTTLLHSSLFHHHPTTLWAYTQNKTAEEPSGFRPGGSISQKGSGYFFCGECLQSSFRLRFVFRFPSLSISSSTVRYVV